MSDKYKGLTVTFENDLYDEQVEHVIDAIRMIKGVLTVTPSVVDNDDLMNRAKISIDYKRKILNWLDELR